MIRTLAAAVLASAAMLAATGASAQTYVATPVVAPAKNVLITRDTAWSLRNGAFVTANAPMREMLACQLVARGTGELSAFTADGRSFDATELATCNSKARGGKTSVAKAGAAAAVAN